MDFETLLNRYAELIVRVGLNIQPGQWLRISAPIETAPFIQLIARHAYQAGSHLVDVIWNDPQLALIRYAYAPDEAFEDVPQYRLQAGLEHVERGSAFLSISAEDPELLQDADPLRVMRAVIANSQLMQPVMGQIMADLVPWCVVSLPIAAWARKVYSGVGEAEALARLWDAIFSLCRLKTEDPIAAWHAHHAELTARAAALSARQYRQLHYRGHGTDLRVGLIEGHQWLGGGTQTPQGHAFMPNIPTEEVFTTPHYAQTEGYVSGSMPFSYNGALIDGFRLTFAGGQVVDYSATQGQDVLGKLLDADEGARRLGEVALVPHSSPIGQMGVLFYNGLYDENAACHMALGRAYEAVIPGAAGQSEAELLARGVNQSLLHQDMMIGSAALDVDGLRADGTIEPILRAGEWAFSL